MIKAEVVHRINEWAYWVVRIEEGSALGYPHQTSEARMMAYHSRVDRRPATAIAPAILMPSSISVIDRAVRNLGEDEPKLLRILWYHHMEPGRPKEKVSAYCQANSLSEKKYYIMLSEGYRYIQGSMKTP